MGWKMSLATDIGYSSSHCTRDKRQTISKFKICYKESILTKQSCPSAIVKRQATQELSCHVFLLSPSS